jgi:hypothetical protein
MFLEIVCIIFCNWIGWWTKSHLLPDLPLVFISSDAITHQQVHFLLCYFLIENSFVNQKREIRSVLLLVFVMMSCQE